MTIQKLKYNSVTQRQQENLQTLEIKQHISMGQ